MSTTTVYANQSCYLNGNPYKYEPAVVNENLMAKDRTDYTNPVKSFIGFGIPQNVKQQEITAAVLYLYGKINSGSGNLLVHEISQSFNENSVTNDNAPYLGTVIGEMSDFTGTDAWKTKSVLDWFALSFGVGLSVGNGASAIYEIDSSRTLNPPRVLLTYSVPTPTASPVEPSSGSTASRSYPITFSWGHTYSPTGILLSGAAQKSAKIRYKATGGAYVEKSITGSENIYTIPANTLTADSSEWQVVVTDDNGQTATSEWVQFNSLVAPGNPTILYPSNTAIDATRENTFAWQHNFTAPQDAAQLNITGTNIISESSLINIGSSQSYTAPANSLKWISGEYKWYVRTQSSGVWSGWSEASANLIAPLPAPAVAFDSTTSKSIVHFAYVVSGGIKIWSAFRVKVGNYDSGVLTGGTAETSDGTTVTSEFALPTYLDAGSQTVQVQCCDANGIWSTWAQATTTIVNTPPAAITLAAAQSGQAVSLSWGENAAFTAYYIFRDGVMVAKTTANAYADNFAGMGDHVYKVRGVDGTNYADSNEVTVTVTVTGAWITPVDVIDWVSIGLKAGNPYGFSRDVSGSVVYNHYDGNTAASILAQKSIGNTFAISELTYAGRKKLEGYINKTVCVKTSRGDVIFGVLDKAGNDIFSNYSDIALSVGEVTYTEEISYE